MVLTRHTAVVDPTPDPRIRYLAPSGESWVSVARSNGIRPGTFASRIRYGWDPQDAATRPVRPSQLVPLAPSKRTWASIARQNGVHPATFHKRLRAGLTPAQAASGPSNRLPQTPDGERWRDVALRHAISRSTFYTRVANGWNPADAATTRLGGKRPAAEEKIPWQPDGFYRRSLTEGSVAVNGQSWQSWLDRQYGVTVGNGPVTMCGGSMAERPVVEDWAEDWDTLGRQYHECAPEVWDELRERCPVAHTNRYHGVWMPVRYEDVFSVAHDPATFSSIHPLLCDDSPDTIVALPPIGTDPPEHTGYRRALLPRFTPIAISRLEPITRSICNGLLDTIVGRTQADAGLDYARHVPTQVTLAMLGLPAEDAEQFCSWVHDIVEIGQSESEPFVRATREILQYFRQQIEHRREHGGDDVVASLVGAEVDGEAIPDRTISAMLMLLIIAGVDTTWNVLGAALLHLATYPEDQARLRTEPALIDTAIEEFLRFYAPAEVPRLATTDCEIAGTYVKAGEHVWLSYPAANRDPAAFLDADQVILDRTHNRHLAFGAGIHRCLGSNLARMELRVALTAWLRRIPTFALKDGAAITWTTGGNIRGPRSIPVVWS